MSRLSKLVVVRVERGNDGLDANVVVNKCLQEVPSIYLEALANPNLRHQILHFTTLIQRH